MAEPTVALNSANLAFWIEGEIWDCCLCMGKIYTWFTIAHELAIKPDKIVDTSCMLQAMVV